MKRWRLVLMALSIVLIVTFGIVPGGIAYLTVSTLLTGNCNQTEPLPELLPHISNIEAVTIQSEPHFTLDGWFAPGTNGAGIIILSGAWGTADSMFGDFEYLHAAGYSVLTIDTRTCGNPGQQTTLGAVEQRDLRAAVDFMAERVDHIGVLGFSMGGAVAILTAAEDERIEAVVALGNYSRFIDNIQPDFEPRPNLVNLWERWTRYLLRVSYEAQADVDLSSDLNPIDHINEISPRAVFLIHGSLEQTEGVAQYQAAGTPKQFWLIDGADHGQYYSTQGDEYVRRVVTFFNEYLGRE